MTIQAPNTASTGERYAVVWASLGTKPDPTSKVSRLEVVNRVGVRVYLHVGPGAEPSSEFTIGKVTPVHDGHGHSQVTIDVKNTGERALDISGKVTLSDGPDGAHAGPFNLSATTLAQGEPGTVAAQLPGDLDNGPWKVAVNLKSGVVKHAATGAITFPEAGQPGKPSLLSTSGTAWTTVGASAVVGFVAVTGLVFTARRVRRRTTVRED